MKMNMICKNIVSHCGGHLAVMIVAASALVASLAMAQQPSAKVAQSVSTTAPIGAKEVLSSDGTLMAHFGKEVPTVLYIKNVSTGEDQPILKRKSYSESFDAVEGMDFSQDGSSIVFEAGHTGPYTGAIYRAKTDGTGMTTLATDQLFPPDGPGIKGYHHLGMGWPQYSPDGKNILVSVDVANSKPVDSHIDYSDSKLFVGMLAAEGSDQTPELLDEGLPLFWSHDSSGIYFTKSGTVYRYDVASKQSKQVLDIKKVVILGRVPGADAVFTRTMGRENVTLDVATLDGTAANESLKTFIKSIPQQDANGRDLSAIEPGGPHQLLLRYKADLNLLVRQARTREDIQAEKGQFEGVTQTVSFQ